MAEMAPGLSIPLWAGRLALVLALTVGAWAIQRLVLDGRPSGPPAPVQAIPKWDDSTLDALAQRPLFVPQVLNGAQGPQGGWQLQGVVAGREGLAVLRSAASGKSQVAALGDELPGGERLLRIDGDGAVLQAGPGQYRVAVPQRAMLPMESTAQANGAAGAARFELPLSR